MTAKEKYPRERKLDGVYFRVKRDGKWKNLCFSDLTKTERDIVTEGKSADWLRRLACIMADVVRELGDCFDIVNCHHDEEETDG